MEFYLGLNLIFFMYLPKRATAAFITRTVFTRMCRKARQTNTESAFIAYVPRPVFGVFFSAILARDIYHGILLLILFHYFYSSAYFSPPYDTRK